MKLLLCSYAFYPSIGGIESVSLTLAKVLSANQHHCKVVTQTSAAGIDSFPFEIIRQPTRAKQVKLTQWADLIIYNGANLQLQPWPIILRKPFIWIHQGYQVTCIDGLGWADGKPSPLNPYQSFLQVKQQSGWITAIQAGLKLWMRRTIAHHFVSQNVAITKWMASVQPLPHQQQIYNPFDLSRFTTSSAIPPDYAYIFVGRLVSEKGVATLLRALALVHQQTGRAERVLLIGDGPAKADLEALARQLQIHDSVTFAGRQSGKDLTNWIARGQIAVVPSEYYEPMGIVALELLAAGKNIIVSEQGGLKECVGEAGLTFPNGDHTALAKAMIELLTNKDLRQKQRAIAQEQIKLFDPAIAMERYSRLVADLGHRR